ncbi:serine hydrolase [Novosphingobium sp. NPDC080210]|uniref:serine hydrolase n=1 Tax=Novosphingobium sp. NPDC080210 TaxID=3390596 RepID=UPI003D00F078
MTRLKRDDPATLNSSLAPRRSPLLRRLGMIVAGTAALAGMGMAYGKLSGTSAALSDAAIKPAQARTPRKAANCAPRPEALQQEINRIAASFQGKVGIGVTQAGCDWVVGARQDEFFPQQSVSKLWVALSVMDAVDQGKVRLDQPLTLRPEDLVVFNQPMRWRLLEEGSLTLPVQTLLQNSLSLSDNLANDKLLWTVGGPDHVRGLLKERGLEGIRFGPGERLLQSAIAGLQWTPELAQARNFDDARERLPLEHRQELLARYVADPMDGATPAGISKALGQLAMGDLLSPSATQVMLDIMAHSRSGPRRLKGGVPAGWKVYHKTGTGQELRGLATGYNDVAVFVAPDGTSYGVAVMIGETRQPIPVRMEMMQAVSRAVAAAHDSARSS